MWPRIVETMFCLWLYVSPFIFSYPKQDKTLWIVTFASATVIAFVSLQAYRRVMRHANALTLGLAVALGLVGYFVGGVQPSPAYQNLLIVGLLIAMSAALPTCSSEPPLKWQSFYQARSHSNLPNEQWDHDPS